VAQQWRARAQRRIFGLGVPLVFLAIVGRHVNLEEGLRMLAQSGPLTVLALLPYGVMLAIDSLAWRLLLAPATRARVGLASSFAARTAGEAVGQSLPSAGIAGEAAAAWLLRLRAGTPLGEVIGTLAARRFLLALGHGLILAAAAVVIASSTPTVPTELPWLLALSAAAMLVVAAVGPGLLRRTSPFARLHLALRRVPWAALQVWLEYLTESVETFLLLVLLGAEVSPVAVLAVEPLLSLLRAAVFFVPAGLGVQDLGYVAFLHACGVPEAATLGAAFVVLKRLKELVWVATGWTILLAAGGRDAVPAGRHEEKTDEPRATTHPVHLRVAQPDDPDASDRARAARA
jgi:uncharacterized membrane protein YbhN (UPF0104 family)